MLHGCLTKKKMIQKKIKKWYPTKEKEEAVELREHLLSRLATATDALDRARERQLANGDYIIVSPEAAELINDWHPQTTTTVTEKITFGNKFKKDFGKWDNNKFLFNICLWFTMALIVSLCHYFIGSKPTWNNKPIDFTTVVLIHISGYFTWSALIWTLGKLWNVRHYISLTLKLSLLVFILIPIYMLHILEYGMTKDNKFSSKIIEFIIKCFSKKEKEITKSIGGDLYE